MRKRRRRRSSWITAWAEQSPPFRRHGRGLSALTALIAGFNDVARKCICEAGEGDTLFVHITHLAVKYRFKRRPQLRSLARIKLNKSLTMDRVTRVTNLLDNVMSKREDVFHESNWLD